MPLEILEVALQKEWEPLVEAHPCCGRELRDLPVEFLEADRVLGEDAVPSRHLCDDEQRGGSARVACFAGILAACAFVGPASPLPRTIQIGAFAESLRPFLAQDCLRTTERQYEGVQAAPFTRQLQINCSDLQVFGAPREVEFLFNDGPLGHVWILVPGEELKELRGQLEKVFGPVVHETDLDLVFASGTVALRKRPPEVLVATPALISDITGWSPAAQGKTYGHE